MLKEYRKTATIKAEQFDGSEEMVKRYNIYPDETQVKGEVYYFVLGFKDDLLINIGDWIATGEDGEHWIIEDDIFKKTYEEMEE